VPIVLQELGDCPDTFGFETAEDSGRELKLAHSNSAPVNAGVHQNIQFLPSD
jgi:hypothetical protein